MDKLVAFSEYLENIGVDINTLSFQDAVNLQIEVENLIKSKQK